MLKKFNKILCMLLVLTTFVTSTGIQAFATEDNSIETNLKEDLGQFIESETGEEIDVDESTLNELNRKAFEALPVDVQKRLIYIMQMQAKSGNTEPLDYHKKYINPDFKPISVKELNIKLGGMGVLEVLSSELNEIGLSAAVYDALMTLGGSIAASFGDLGTISPLDILATAGAIYAIARLGWHWREVSEHWSEIVDAFKEAFDTAKDDIEELFDQIKAKITGLPTEKEFHDFDRHYNDHAKEFADMPGGGGKKPDKKKYWEMAKKFLKEKGSYIKEGTDKYIVSRAIKFNTKTLEYLVYEKATGQIITYYLPKWDEWRYRWQWPIKAYEYFEGRIK